MAYLSSLFLFDSKALVRQGFFYAWSRPFPPFGRGICDTFNKLLKALSILEKWSFGRAFGRFKLHTPRDLYTPRCSKAVSALPPLVAPKTQKLFFSLFFLSSRTKKSPV